MSGRKWARLVQQRPFEFEVTVALYGCHECGLAVWDRERHEAVCPSPPLRQPPSSAPTAENQ